MQSDPTTLVDAKRVVGLDCMDIISPASTFQNDKRKSHKINHTERITIHRHYSGGNRLITVFAVCTRSAPIPDFFLNFFLPYFAKFKLD